MLNEINLAVTPVKATTAVLLLSGRPLLGSNVRLFRYFFENAALCGYCNGDGCRGCGHSGIAPWYQFRIDRGYGDDVTLGVEYTACVKELTTFRNVDPQ